MGIFDKIKDAASGHEDKIDEMAEQGIEKVGDAADSMTGGKFPDQIDQGQDMANEQVDRFLGTGEPKADEQ